MYVVFSLVIIECFAFYIFYFHLFQSDKIDKRKIGLLSSIIFVFGLFSFVTNNNSDDNKEQNSNKIKSWTLNAEDTLLNNSTSYIQADLEKTNYNLGITYRQEKNTKSSVPVNAYSSTTRFIAGTNWKPFSISINKTRQYCISV